MVRGYNPCIPLSPSRPNPAGPAPTPAFETLGPEPTEPGPTPFSRIFAALRYRDFRVLWLGAFTSSTGTWVQKVAQSWLVLSLTGSPFFLGLDAFLGELPILLFTLLGGVVADRRDRRQLLLASQYIQMAAAFTLALLVYLDIIHIWHVLVLSFVTGLAQAFGGPAYQSLIPSLVATRVLPNAIAFNSIQFNLARAVGPLIAGIALAAIGYSGAFTLNGLSFLVVIAALQSLRVTSIPPIGGQTILAELKSGIAHVRSEPGLKALTVLAFAATFLAIPLSTLMPVMTQQIFQVAPSAADAARSGQYEGFAPYSRLMFSFGSGAVIGALVVAWLGRGRHMGATMLAMQAGLGGLVVAFALLRVGWLSYPLLFGCGVAQMMVFSMMTSLVQLIAPDEMRGRVMSIYMVAFRGGMPLGSLVSGYVANLVPAAWVLAANGVLLALVAGSLLVTNHGVRRL